MHKSIRRAYLSKKGNISTQNEVGSTSFTNTNNSNISNIKNMENSSNRQNLSYKSNNPKFLNKSNIPYNSTIKNGKNINNNKEKINNKQNYSFITDKDNKNITIHENNLEIIENLQKELNNIKKENDIISKNIILNKKSKTKLYEQYNKVLNDIESQKKECKDLKDITTSKKRYFLNLVITRNQTERVLNVMTRLINNRNNSNNSNNNNINRRNELNRNLFRSTIDRLVELYRRRRGNEEDTNISFEQLQSLPSSIYPRINRNNEKCIICGFVFCYQDIIVKLNNCNHIFHKNCLVNRLTIRCSSKCPICNLSVI